MKDDDLIVEALNSRPEEEREARRAISASVNFVEQIDILLSVGRGGSEKFEFESFPSKK